MVHGPSDESHDQGDAGCDDNGDNHNSGNGSSDDGENGNIQKSILQKQEQILSRLAQLERQQRDLMKISGKSVRDSVAVVNMHMQYTLPCTC